MIQISSTKKGPAKIKVDGDLRINDVAELHAALLSNLSTGRKTVVDLKAVEDIDSAGMQLLMAMARSVADSGSQISLVVDQQVLVSSSHKLGLDPAEFAAAIAGGA